MVKDKDVMEAAKLPEVKGIEDELKHGWDDILLHFEVFELLIYEMYHSQYKPAVQTHTGFCTCVTRKYPHPNQLVSIPVLAGAGFMQVWVQVRVDLPMGDP